MVFAELVPAQVDSREINFSYVGGSQTTFRFDIPAEKPAGILFVRRIKFPEEIADRIPIAGQTFTEG